MYESPFICKAIDAYDHDGSIYIILEKMTGSMDKLSLNGNACNMTLKPLKYACYSMFKALEYVHKHHLIHRDLKPENSLFDMQGNIMLCDFGQSIQMYANMELPTSECATRGFRAPEIRKGLE
jgi:serine/threonine protein kinase